MEKLMFRDPASESSKNGNDPLLDMTNRKKSCWFDVVSLVVQAAGDQLGSLQALP